MIRGIPFRATMDDILSFFEGHGSLKEENITIEEMNGRKTGSCLIVFENCDQAQAAKEAKQKGDMGGRCIDCFDENDSMMQRICRL
jgi:RNA recognition motif-containing protein